MIIRSLIMKTLCIVLTLLTCASTSDERNRFLVRWERAIDDPHRNFSLYETPRSLEEIRTAGWVEATDASSNGVSVYCMENDPRICTLLDKNGCLAGFQVGILVRDVENMQSIYDLSKINTFKVENIFGEKVWTTTIYVEDPEIIRTGGCKRRNGRTKIQGVWIPTTDGYMTIPRKVANLDPIWLKQICIPEMGTHYYYNMSTSFVCENNQPWFLLYDDDEELIGGGIMGFGKTSIGRRDWYEELKVPIKTVIPESSQCLTDWIAEYGLIYTHVFFNDKPWEITC